jgi:N-terminal domain of anti-restriction factor ArdC
LDPLYQVVYQTIDIISSGVYALSIYMPREEYGSRYGEVSREERLKETLQTLEHGIDSILSSEGFASYLQTLARFHSYSFGNVLLIRAQRPNATRVAGYRKWLELGRQVKKGEQGIKILVPFKHKTTVTEEDSENAVIVKGFGVGTVELMCPARRAPQCPAAYGRRARRHWDDPPHGDRADRTVLCTLCSLHGRG